MLKRAPVAGSKRRRGHSRFSEERLSAVDIIEASLSPAGEPVLGMYITAVHSKLVRSISARREYRSIVPRRLAIASLLDKHPGISQIELAAHLGITRAAAGKQVAAFVRRGWVRRELSADNARRYTVNLTLKGELMLKHAAEVVPVHEHEFAAALTPAERRTLRRLLRKMLI